MNFNEIKKAVVNAAEKAGVTEYEIYFVQDSGMSAETLKHEISSFSSSVSGGICFRCVVDGKMGYASSELMEVDEMEELVYRAVSNAKYVESDDGGVIFAGSPKYEKINAPEPRVLDAAHIKEMALSIQKEMYEASDKVIDGCESAVMTSEMWIRIFNSYGLDLENHVGRNLAYAQAAINVDGEPANSFVIRRGNDHKDFEGMSKEAVDSALAKIGAGHVETGVYNIIFDKYEMASLLSAFSPVFSAKNAQHGMSLLAGKEGEMIASECLTVTDDPFREGYELQTHFDAEGAATFRKKVIENGRLNTLLHNLATAKKAGIETTGNASKAGYAGSVEISPYCFCIEGSDITEEELFRLADNGIYVTDLMGLHAGVNAVTGDFSIEASGFMIENGKKGRPVKTFTVAGNFFEMIKNIEAVADNVKIGMGGFTAFGAPSVLVKNISVAG